MLACVVHERNPYSTFWIHTAASIMAEGGHDYRIIPKGRGRGGNITSALTQTAAPKKIGRHGLGPTAIVELVGSGAKKMEGMSLCSYG